jgi:hypothetical protein
MIRGPQGTRCFFYVRCAVVVTPGSRHYLYWLHAEVWRRLWVWKCSVS